MLCKKSLSNPVRFGRKQRQIVDFCAVVYLGSSKGSFFISKGLATFFILKKGNKRTESRILGPGTELIDEVARAQQDKTCYPEVTIFVCLDSNS